MKLPLLVCLASVCVSCTTLENRRDLYRSPAEGYEHWSRHAPPTRKPAGPPVGGTATKMTTTTTTTTTRHGVIAFPEESLPQGQ